VGEVVNIGSNSEISIKELTLSIKKLMNSDTVDRTEEERLRPAKSGVEQLRCDNYQNQEPGELPAGIHTGKRAE
jgi:nucleoside-diphosphate-sugar epimerase